MRVNRILARRHSLTWLIYSFVSNKTCRQLIAMQAPSWLIESTRILCVGWCLYWKNLSLLMRPSGLPGMWPMKARTNEAPTVLNYRDRSTQLLGYAPRQSTDDALPR